MIYIVYTHGADAVAKVPHLLVCPAAPKSCLDGMYTYGTSASSHMTGT